MSTSGRRARGRRTGRKERGSIDVKGRGKERRPVEVRQKEQLPGTSERYSRTRNGHSRVKEVT